MPRAAKYRRHTAECLRMARTAAFRDFGDRMLLIEMAAMWLRLAEYAEAQERKSESSGNNGAQTSPIFLRYCSGSAADTSGAAQSLSLALEMAVARALEPLFVPPPEKPRGPQDAE